MLTNSLLNYSVPSSFISIKKNTTDTAVSYLEILPQIDSENRLRTTLYDKIDDFDFPHCELYLSQLMRHSRACGSYNDFLEGMTCRIISLRSNK